MNTQKMPLKNSLCLLLAATIWGIAFVAQSVGMEYVGPFTFNGVRSLIGAAVLVPVIFLLNRSKDTASAAADPSTSTTTSSPYKTRDLWIGGIACGIFGQEALGGMGGYLYGKGRPLVAAGGLFGGFCRLMRLSNCGRSISKISPRKTVKSPAKKRRNNNSTLSFSFKQLNTFKTFTNHRGYFIGCPPYKGNIGIAVGNIF